MSRNLEVIKQIVVEREKLHESIELDLTNHAVLMANLSTKIYALNWIEVASVAMVLAEQFQADKV